MRFFAENGVKGVYEEGNYQSVSPDITELRSWLLAKLLWNPYFDVEQGIIRVRMLPGLKEVYLNNDNNDEN